MPSDRAWNSWTLATPPLRCRPARMEIGNGFPRPCVSPTAPQLKRLAWQVHGAETLRPAEALDIYERNWRHVDKAALQAHEPMAG